MNAMEAGTVLQRLSNLWPRQELAPGHVGEWRRWLTNHDVHIVHKALDLLRETEEWMPSIGKLATQVASLERWATFETKLLPFRDPRKIGEPDKGIDPAPLIAELEKQLTPDPAVVRQEANEQEYQRIKDAEHAQRISEDREEDPDAMMRNYLRDWKDITPAERKRWGVDERGREKP